MRRESDTNHYNFANVLKGTVRNAAILDRVTHKSQGLPQHTAKHLTYNENKSIALGLNAYCIKQ